MQQAARPHTAEDNSLRTHPQQCIVVRQQPENEKVHHAQHILVSSRAAASVSIQLGVGTLQKASTAERVCLHQSLKMTALAESLRRTVELEGATTLKDTRFEFGTEYTEFKKPPEEAYAEIWRPLPVSYEATQQSAALGRHLISQSAIFPRLRSDLEVVKGKLVPKLTVLMEACKKLDLTACGYITQDDMVSALQHCGVFMSSADLECLLPYVPRNPAGALSMQGLSDLLLGKEVTTTSTGMVRGRPKLPDVISWPEDQSFTVTLRMRPNSEPFTLEGSRMASYARYATQLCKEEVDAEKVHALLRHHLMDVLILEPGRPGHPDLGFKNWLIDNGVLSLTTRQRPGPIPPEVYDVLDSIIYQGLGLPIVISPTQTLTALGASLKRGTLF